MNGKRFLELMGPIAALIEAKDKDYNSAVPLDSYFPFGHRSYVQMLHTKTSRLVSLVETGQAPKFESIEDTIRDNVAYSAFYLDWLQRNTAHIRGAAPAGMVMPLDPVQEMQRNLIRLMMLIERARDHVPPSLMSPLHTLEMDSILASARGALEDYAHLSGKEGK